MSQQRIEVSLAGQKITLATSAEHEHYSVQRVSW